jgi:protein-tyrosine-phosphatase
MKDKIKILFVCNDNSLLSQMAEAMVRLYRSDEVVAYSAGISPANSLNVRIQELMGKIGYSDMHQHQIKSINDVKHIQFNYVITIGTPVYLSEIRADIRLEWRFAEPDELDETQLIYLRDKLLNKVLNFVISVAA